MSRPYPHSATGVFWFRQRVPADLKDKLAGKPLTITVADAAVTATHGAEVKFSLRTKNATEARQRHAEVAVQVQRFWEATRRGPARLTQRQVVALAGTVYAEFVGSLGDDPGTPERWRLVIEADQSAQAGDFGSGSLMIGAEARRRASMEERFGPFADHVLAREGLVIDEESRSRLLDATAGALRQMAQTLQRNATGDYRPDPDADRFGEWKRPEPAKNDRAKPMSLQAMFDKWAQQHERDGKSSASRDRFGSALKNFRAFLQHDDARRVTAGDVERWKDALVDSGLSSRTIATVSLPAIRLILDETLDGERLATNPAREVRFKARKKAEERGKEFTPAEAKAILKAAKGYVGSDREQAKNIAAKRWLPWLCAYTGARIGEVAQLRREDVGIEDGIPYIHITPEAGQTKTGKEWYVPLHPDLVDQGFLTFVEASPDGHLFYDATKLSHDRPWRLVSKNIGEWIREVVKVDDPRVQPNHAWRHTFKTAADEAGIDPKFSDYMCGHAPKTEGHRYGRRTLSALHQQVVKLARYRLD